MADSERVLGAVSSLLRRMKKAETVELDTRLFAEGIGLDSLQAAELSVMLEDELGRDPFSDGQMPQTVGEIIDYYDK